MFNINLILLGIVFILLGTSCSTVCKRKLCCPDEGHGKCPFCHIEDYEADLSKAIK